MRGGPSGSCGRARVSGEDSRGRRWGTPEYAGTGGTKERGTRGGLASPRAAGAGEDSWGGLREDSAEDSCGPVIHRAMCSLIFQGYLSLSKRVLAAERGRCGSSAGWAVVQVETAAPTDDILLPAGQPVGTVSPGATPNVRTVTPSEFQALRDALMTGARAVSKPGYPGDWYERPDGSSFGLMSSAASGPTIDADGPALPRGFKVHQR